MKDIIKKNGWKGVAIILLSYSLIGGLLMDVPRLNILNETIRNLYYHVPLWFAMVVLFFLSVWYAGKYLIYNSPRFDILSIEYARTGLVFGFLGVATGMIWATYTWGSPWHGDPKQNGVAIALLIYIAYFVLRGSMEDKDYQSRFSAVYNIFAFITLIPLIFIIPRMTSSMHPGSGGNPGFNMYDLDTHMRWVFYPAVVGWICLGIWIAQLHIRIQMLSNS